MKRTVLLWVIALVVTLGGAYYQRVTGPTYPLAGSVIIEGSEVAYKLPRSHGGDDDCKVRLPVVSANIRGTLLWKRYKTNDEWTRVEMNNEHGTLAASLPHQPPAGKVMYRIEVTTSGKVELIPSDEPVVIRFKGDVPLAILILHIIAMFGAMLLSTRTGLEYFGSKAHLKQLTYWTLGFLVVGGLILGPLVQHYAFGALWTGVPFGTDLTDNKTLIAFIGWLVAALALFKSRHPEWWTLGAAVLLLIVYLIPHSVFGSELDYGKQQTVTSRQMYWESKSKEPEETTLFPPAGFTARRLS